MSNQKSRVDQPGAMVTGPLAGEGLLENFKAEIIKESVFAIMFGENGERIFTQTPPSLNETILPCMVLSWKSEIFNSNDTYQDGFVTANLMMPVKLIGDYNALRRTALMIQRWMGGTMSLFGDSNPGLIKFGYGTDFNYEGLAKADGLSCPVIQMNIPYRFDLMLMSVQVDGFDPNLPLDDSDVGFVEQILLKVFDQETDNILLQQGVLVETGQTN